MNRKTLFASILLILTILCSCSTKKFIYLTDVNHEDKINITTPEAKIVNNDIIQIIISGPDLQLAAPFNLAAVANLGKEGLLTASPALQSYVVNTNGEIEMPILGKIKVAGLTKSELIDKVKTLLTPYLKEPVVTVNFMDFKISVLGDVAKPGIYTIQNERVSIFEALGLAGDLTMYGNRTNILVVRENEGGNKEFGRININSKEILTSPYYFLQQNDVVYVEPIQQKVDITMTANAGIWISGLSVLTSVATLIITVTK